MNSYSLCCLSNINLSTLVYSDFTEDAYFNFSEFKRIVRIGIRFLDNVLDTTEYPIDKIKESSMQWRRIGLGITGLADMLLKLGIRYGSPESVDFVSKIAKTMAIESYTESSNIAKEKGSFLAFDENIGEYGFIKKLPEDLQKKIKTDGLRNIGVNTIPPTGCLIPNSIVSTNKGLLTLEELIPDYRNYDDFSWISQNNLSASNEHNDYCSVEHTFVNTKAPTKKIITKSGVELEGTPNHKFRVLSDNRYIWKELKDIMVDDIIIYKIGGYNKKENKQLILPDYKKHFNEKDITLPTEMSAEFAFFLGLYNADGSTHRKGVRIHLNHLTNEAKEVTIIIKKLFNWDSATISNERNCDSVYISSQRLLAFLKKNELIKNKSMDIIIPKAVRESSAESILAYINGYFYGDGSTSNGVKSIGTYSKENAQQLAIVMREVGINSRVEKYDKSKDKNSYSNNISYKVYWKAYGSIGEDKKWRYINKETRYIKEALEEYGKNLFGDRVIDIKDSEAYTLDLEIPNGRTYIANSYISHNTTSLTVGNNCSSGIEPIFALEYTRNITQPDGSRKPEKVYDDGWLEYTKKFESEEKTKYVVTAHDIKIKEAIDVQSAFQEWIDHSISRTINMPYETTLDEYKDIFLYAWSKGLKGITSFHEGASMEGILSTNNNVNKRHAPKRPKELPCDIYEMMVNKQKCIALVGMYDNKPYEVFLTDDPDEVINIKKAKHGKIIKEKTSVYTLVIEGKRSDYVLKDISSVFDNEWATLGRLVSMSLRHDVPLQFIIDQLNKTKQFGTFAKGMARVLRKYIQEEKKEVCPECGGEMIVQGGCSTCKDCGYSKCD